MVKGYSLDFLKSPYQTRKTPSVRLGQEQKAIQKKIYQKNQFTSHFLLASKKDGRKRTVINLKELNKFIFYVHSKI